MEINKRVLLSLNKRTEGFIICGTIVNNQSLTRETIGRFPAGINEPAVVEQKLNDFALRIMTHVTPEEIVEFVRSRGELHLSTLAQMRPFVVRGSDDTLEFIPSSGTPRSRDRESVARVCEEFSRTNSWHPGDYADLSVHASYTLALMDAYLKSK